MIQRRTQTATYWVEEFEVDADDVGLVYDHILDLGRPVSSTQLAQMLIERRCRQDEQSIRAGLDEGQLYQPKNVYEEGENLIFPALGLAKGVVSGFRSGVPSLLLNCLSSTRAGGTKLW